MPRGVSIEARSFLGGRQRCHKAGENKDKDKDMDDDDDVTADVVMSLTCPRYGIQLNKAWKPHKVVARQDNQAQLFGN